MTEPRESAIDTARKLLRLKDRAGTPAEALAAARALSKLLDKHRIAVTELEMDGSQDAEPFEAAKDDPLYEFKRVQPWKRDLGSVLAKHFGCAYWQRTRKFHTGQTSEHAMCLCGRPSDIALVRGMYTWLTGEIAQLSVTHCRGEGARYSNSWRKGFVTGVDIQLTATRDELQAKTTAAMVLYGREEQAQKYLQSVFEQMGTITWKSSVRADRTAYFAGLRVGKTSPLGPRLQGAEAEPDQLPLLDEGS